MGATILPFPILDGALCVVEPRRNIHRGRDKPVSNCQCEACDGRREELALAAKIEEELRAGLQEEEIKRLRREILERDAG
jgi:hypothetical protein